MPLFKFGKGGNHHQHGGHGGSHHGREPGSELTVQNMHVKIIQKMAEGGFGSVYSVMGEKHEKYALKTMKVLDQETLEIAQREIDFMSRVRGHANIVDLIAHDIAPCGRHTEALLLMEYCPGGHVVDIMNRRLNHHFTEKEILKIFCDVCLGIAALHFEDPPIIHRDIKLENVLLGADMGCFKLCDFGSATTAPLSPGDMPIALMEEEIEKFTTPQYRAPEMVNLYMKKSVDERADIWALGCILYKLMFYSDAFDDGTLSISNGSYKIPKDHKHSDALIALLKSMLVVDPDKRADIATVTESVCKLRGIECPLVYPEHICKKTGRMPSPQRATEKKRLLREPVRAAPPRPGAPHASKDQAIRTKSHGIGSKSQHTALPRERNQANAMSKADSSPFVAAPARNTHATKASNDGSSSSSTLPHGPRNPGNAIGNVDELFAPSSVQASSRKTPEQRRRQLVGQAPSARQKSISPTPPAAQRKTLHKRTASNPFSELMAEKDAESTQASHRPAPQATTTQVATVSSTSHQPQLQPQPHSSTTGLPTRHRRASSNPFNIDAPDVVTSANPFLSPIPSTSQRPTAHVTPAPADRHKNLRKTLFAQHTRADGTSAFETSTPMKKASSQGHQGNPPPQSRNDSLWDSRIEQHLADGSAAKDTGGHDVSNNPFLDLKMQSAKSSATPAISRGLPPKQHAPVVSSSLSSRTVPNMPPANDPGDASNVDILGRSDSITSDAIAHFGLGDEDEEDDEWGAQVTLV